MNIFESLENLDVSEECFDDILGLVEELLNEGSNLYNLVKRAEDNNDAPYPNSYSDEYKRKRERLKEILGNGNAERLKDIALDKIKDSKSYKVNKRSGASGKLFRDLFHVDNTDKTLGNEEERALKPGSIEAYEREKRQINKAKGRYYRK